MYYAAGRSRHFVVWRVSAVEFCGPYRVRVKKIKKILYTYIARVQTYEFNHCGSAYCFSKDKPTNYDNGRARSTGPVVGGCCDAMEECQWFT